MFCCVWCTLIIRSNKLKCLMLMSVLFQNSETITTLCPNQNSNMFSLSFLKHKSYSKLFSILFKQKHYYIHIIYIFLFQFAWRNHFLKFPRYFWNYKTLSLKWCFVFLVLFCDISRIFFKDGNFVLRPFTYDINELGIQAKTLS